MNKTQRIRYTLASSNTNEISKGKVSIEYKLVDDKGNQRIVNAFAKRNLFNKITAVRPVHHRELPLVKELSKAKLYDQLFVDFTEFNKNYARGTTRSQTMSVPSVKLTESSQPINDFGSVVANKNRMIQLVAASLVAFVILVFFMT